MLLAVLKHHQHRKLSPGRGGLTAVKLTNISWSKSDKSTSSGCRILSALVTP